MDNRLKDIVIFEYEIDEYGNPINNLEDLSEIFRITEERIPKGMKLIALPDSIKLKDMDEKDLSEINKNLIDDILKVMEIGAYDWMDGCHKVDTSKMSDIGDDE